MNLFRISACLGVLCLASLSAAADGDGSSAGPRHDVASYLTASNWGKRPVAERKDVLILKTYGSLPAWDSDQASPRLISELARQALLITARDLLGLATRDQSLGESVFEIKESPDQQLPEARGSLQIIASLSGELAKPTAMNMTLFRENPDGPITLWEKSLSLEGSPKSVLLELSQALEELSRTEWVQLLTDVGYKGSQNRFVETSELPEAYLASSTDWDVTSQYFAIRQLHQQIRKDGESPERLAALARAYVRLGSLCRYQFDSAGDAFFARALLYTQRLISLSKDSLLARDTRAYVLALVGNHQATKEDLNEIMKRGATLSAEQILLYDFCEFKNDQLAKHVSDPKLHPLADYLRFLAFEPTSNEAQGVEFAQSLLAEQPRCFAAWNYLSRIGSLDEKAGSTRKGVSEFFTSLAQRFDSKAEHPDATTAIASRLGSDGTNGFDLGGKAKIAKELIDSLRHEGTIDNDTSEPSYQCCAQLLAETGFAMAEQSLYLLRFTYGLPPERVALTLKELQPLIQDHRLAEGAVSYSRSIAENQRMVPEFVRSLDLTERTLAMLPMAQFFSDFSRESWIELMAPATAQLSPIYRDQCKRVLLGASWGGETATSILMPISPHSPAGAVGSIRYFWKWDSTRKEANRFETQFADNGDVLKELAKRYVEDGDLVGAVRLLTKVIELEKSAYTYESLAKVYEKQEDWDGWLKIMKESLESTEDSGLAHTIIRNAIAKHYLERGQATEALPYAVEAAKTWQGESLMAASRCYELLGDKRKSEAFAKALSLRYETGAFEWYYWCQRNASGDLDAARKRLKEVLESTGEGSLSDAFSVNVAVFNMLEEQYDAAYKRLEQSYAKTKDPSTGLFAVTVAGLLDNEEAQNQLLLEIFQQGSTPEAAKERPGHVKLASLLLSDLLKPKDGSPVEGERLKRFLSDYSSKEKVSLNYFVGMWLIQHDRAEQGIQCLTAAAKDYDLRLGRYLAAAYLHKQNVDF